MPDKHQEAHAETTKHEGLSPKQQHERKNRVLTKGTPSIVRSIADAVVIKDGDIFFLTPPDGNVPMDEGHGYGLYYHDCRYLNGYTLKLAGTQPSLLVSTSAEGFTSIYQLTNPDIRMEDGKLIPKEQIGLKWTRTIDGSSTTLQDVLTFRNYGLDAYSFPISMQFRSEFEDVFAVRGLLQETLGKRLPPEWHDDALCLGYEGADGLYRSVSIVFSEKPQKVHDTTAEFDLSLRPREQKQLIISLNVTETPEKQQSSEKQQTPNVGATHDSLRHSSDEWLDRQTSVKSDSLLLNSIMERSLRDLRVLRSSLDGKHYYAAGLPWFGTLFGRDSATVCIQTLAYHTDVAEQTLRLLAQLQGTEVNEYKDEQPGKILHSIRVGEMAHTGEIPHSPYYGTVDATPLFLILMGHYSSWTGDISLFNDLRDNVNRALKWMDEYGDTDSDGYIDYESTSTKGLVNQGWKDSGDAIVNADGSLARPPIALVEVQGYAYMAKLLMADLFRRAGESRRAEALEKQAKELRSRFNKGFWLENEGYYALALQKDDAPCAVLSSNPGQALWTGIVDPDMAKRTVDLLMSDDMYNGWGIRTLTDKATRYSPIAYHLGTVWPHDNSLIAAGFKRYDFDKEARQVCTGIVEAAMRFNNYRLPEVFSGFSREEYGKPVDYPVACHPQAWAAGTVPYLVTTLLGLTPEAFDNRLRIVRPSLPDFTDYIEVQGLRVGKGSADLRFSRNAHGDTEVKVLCVNGDLEVTTEG